MINLQEFKKVDLKVAKIIGVEEHPQADKLYILKIDLGEKQKTLVAGLKPYYSKEELLNKLIIVVNNLEPATIRGVESQGMLLASQDKNNPQKVVIITPEKEVSVGSSVL